MAFDHSTTYRDGRLRNLPHRIRLRDLIRECDRQIGDGRGKSFADFGCSTGYITDILARRFSFARARGFEFNSENLAKAQQSFDSVKFSRLNLNCDSLDEKFDFATCFETLEHVGNYHHALRLMHRALSPGGTLMITVPIEIGAVGLAKFATKVVMGYDVRELTEAPWGRLRYTKAIVTGTISSFRDIDRSGWGTHFGFDYRQVDAALKSMKARYRAFNRATTRFYYVQA